MMPAGFIVKLLALITTAATAAAITAQQRNALHGDPVFQITDNIEFEGRTLHGPLRKSEIAELLDLRVRNGDLSDDGFGAELTTDEGRKVRVVTCRQYQDAIANGWYAATTYDMAMQGWLFRTCECLFALKKAGPVTRSFIAKPRVGLLNLGLLPVNLLSSLRDGERPQNLDRLAARGVTIAGLVSRGQARIES